MGKESVRTPASPIQTEMWDCLTDSQSCFFFVVQIEDANIFLNENSSASSDVFKAHFSTLSEVLSRFVKPDITDIKSLLLFSFPFI